MKRLFIITTFFLSLALNASANTAFDHANEGSGSLEFSVDWDRFEYILKTGDLSCHGDCLQFSIDWKRFSPTHYISERKQRIAHCASQYSQLEDMPSREDSISDDQYDLSLEIRNNAIRAISIGCTNSIGEEEDTNLRQLILNVSF